MKATIAKDINGNKIVRLKPISGRGFSIQTNGNMPELQQLPIGETWESNFCCSRWLEILDYLSDFGTDRQKSFFAYFGK